MHHLRNFWNDEEGQSVVEYAIILSFVSLSVVGLMIGPGTDVKKVWTVANNQLVQANAKSFGGGS
jgi:Flp pilus assembly pilin Flp